MLRRTAVALAAVSLLSGRPAGAHEACVLAERTVCITGGLPGQADCRVLSPDVCRITLHASEIGTDTVELVEVRLFRMPRRHPQEGSSGTVLGGAQARDLIAAVLDVPAEQVQPAGVLYSLGVRRPGRPPGREASAPFPQPEPVSLAEPTEKGKGQGKGQAKGKTPRGKAMKLPEGPMTPEEGFVLEALSLPSRMGLELTEDALDVRLEGYPAGKEPWPILTFPPEATAIYLGGGEDGRLALAVTSRRLPRERLADLGGNRRGLDFVP